MPHAVALTKVDKLSRGEVAGRVAATRKALGGSEVSIEPVSAQAGVGKVALWQLIDQRLASMAGRVRAGKAARPGRNPAP